VGGLRFAVHRDGAARVRILWVSLLAAARLIAFVLERCVQTPSFELQWGVEFSLGLCTAVVLCGIYRRLAERLQLAAKLDAF
jgi:hypothetical protein